MRRKGSRVGGCRYGSLNFLTTEGDTVKYIYKINSQEKSLPHFEIEADNYGLNDGFFHFSESVGTTGRSRTVASVDAKRVFNIERTDNNEAK